MNQSISISAAIFLFCVPASAAPTVLPTVFGSYPHDVGAYTEGLVAQGDWLFESTGRFGESTLRRVDRRTGEVAQSVALPPDQFGEGLALVGDDVLIQLTYKEGIAHVYDAGDLRELRTFQYSGEGWGLCYDGARLIMSDGTDRLAFRDPQTFEITGSIHVTENGLAYSQLNELECVHGEVFANVWQTSFIARINPETGEVLSKVLASGLLTAEEARTADVLNGIAFDAPTGRFLITGKLWPKLFEVEFERPDESPPSAAESCAVEPGGSIGGGPGWVVPLAAALALRERRRRVLAVSS